MPDRRRTILIRQACCSSRAVLSDPMVAVGCLSLIVLPVIGLALGGYFAGAPGARWGAAVGLAIAVALCGASAYALIKVARRR